MLFDSPSLQLYSNAYSKTKTNTSRFYSQQNNHNKIPQKPPTTTVWQDPCGIRPPLTRGMPLWVCQWSKNLHETQGILHLPCAEDIDDHICNATTWGNKNDAKNAMWSSQKSTNTHHFSWFWGTMGHPKTQVSPTKICCRLHCAGHSLDWRPLDVPPSLSASSALPGRPKSSTKRYQKHGAGSGRFPVDSYPFL